LFRAYRSNRFSCGLSMLGVATCLWATSPVQAAADENVEAPVSREAQHQSYVGAGVTSAVQTAIETNPEVRASWHQFLSAEDERDAAFGGYLPSIDARARYGLEHRNYGPVDEYDGYNGEITLTQMLYDGFQTSSSVARFEEQKLAAYFELLSSIEDTSLEVLRAYLDVARQRELLELARQNLETHQDVYEQVSSSAEAGVARAADLEQISGRLSLAESNLVTVASNLHDVKARYLRIVGELPPGEMDEVQLTAALVPETVAETLSIAYEANPGFRAAHREIEAAQANVRENRSGYHPRLDLVASYGHRSFDDVGFDNSETDGRVGIELSMNLYRGGSDRARVRSAYNQVNVAKDLRDKSCVDLRQQIQIAFNDVRNLETQIPVLNNHRLSSARVRTAYKDQFDIGERTLLDLLDAENEYFDASRAYVNALYDSRLAVARVQAGMGHLVTSLGLVRTGLPTLEELGAEPLTVTASACPPTPVDSSVKLLLDNDGDGVRNYKDRCPDTPAGVQVDLNGCAISAELKVIRTGVIEFANDSATIASVSDDFIEEIGRLLANNPEAKLAVVGHASKVGAPGYNQSLSVRRAEAVVDRLVSDYGVARSQMTASGQGYYQPRFSIQSEDALGANRRADIIVRAPDTNAETN